MSILNHRFAPPLTGAVFIIGRCTADMPMSEIIAGAFGLVLAWVVMQDYLRSRDKEREQIGRRPPVVFDPRHPSQRRVDQ